MGKQWKQCQHEGLSTDEHNHDSRYALIGHGHSDYSLTSHNHDERYSLIDHKHNDCYASSTHSHEEYALKSEAATDHNHNNMYACLNHTHTGLVPGEHTHEDYALKSEAATDHNHNGMYACLGHTHNEYADKEHCHSCYIKCGHSHDEYALTSHTHECYASADHTHGCYTTYDYVSANYACKNHTHTGLDVSEHNHDDRYAPLSHEHNNYALSSHTHDDLLSKKDACICYAKKCHTHDYGCYLTCQVAAATYSPIVHTHEELEHGHDCYALKSEAATDHNHDDIYARVESAGTDHTHCFDKFALAGHTHTDVYLPADYCFSKFANADHSHDCYALTDHEHEEYLMNGDLEGYVTTKELEGYALKSEAATDHNHDDIYALAASAGTDHTHCFDKFALAGHEHKDLYLPADFCFCGRFADIDHVHCNYACREHEHSEYLMNGDLEDYATVESLNAYALKSEAASDHNHDEKYAPMTHTHDSYDMAGYALVDHTHRCYAKNEDLCAYLDRNEAAANYAPLSHCHSDIYAPLNHVHTFSEIGSGNIPSAERVCRLEKIVKALHCYLGRNMCGFTDLYCSNFKAFNKTYTSFIDEMCGIGRCAWFAGNYARNINEASHENTVISE